MTSPARILVIDVGGTHVKIAGSWDRVPSSIDSGPAMTAEDMVQAVRTHTEGWEYDLVSIGYPGPVVRGELTKDPVNLAPGWVGFDFAAAFGKPVRMINDAAMQALGSYDGGRMLFLGLGTGLGTAVVDGGWVEPLELAHLPYRKGKSFEEFVGTAGMKRLGKKRWERHVHTVCDVLRSAMLAEYVVLGGGNSKRLRDLPPMTRLGSNEHAIDGGVRLWGDATGRPSLAPGSSAS